MDKLVMEKYNLWLNSDKLSEEEKLELAAIKDDEQEIYNRFNCDLTFGTGGLRGIMAVGTNRMNRHVIGRASQGVANYLLNNYKNPSIVIAYDSRLQSDEFAKVAAMTLAANGVKVYLYSELMPTPALSFAVRYFKCDAGIVVTASHNPKKYNGFKVYGNDGCQATVNSAEAIYNEILKVDIFNDVKSADFDLMVKEGLINLVFDEVFEAYMASTLNESIYKGNRDVKLVYTPLYGAGFRSVTTVLKRDGFSNLLLVEEQIGPDGNFPTTPYPNPEMKEALSMGIDLLLKTNSDVLLATDPDSDRCGVVVNHKGNPVILTGNEVGILLFDFIYNARKEKNDLPQNPVLVKTIVSSDMVNVMAAQYGVEVKEVLTGFKYIGEQILFLEQKEEADRFIFGFEESCGYLSNPNVRDKDAVNAVLLIAEMAAYYASKNLTLKDRMDYLYKTFGDFKTQLLNFEFEESVYKQKINDLMTLFRSEKVKEIIPGIDHIGDYLKGKIIYSDHEVDTNLPSSDVMKFFLEDNETLTIRPSGTEPKLKAYIFANGDDNLNKLVKLATDLIEK